MKSSRKLPKLATLLLAPVLGLSTACSAEPEPAAEESEIYLLDVTEQDWAEPRGIGSEIDAFVPNFLMQKVSETDTTVDFLVATADAEGKQDPCNKTAMITATKGPDFVTIGPTEFPLHIQHVDEPIAVNGMIYGFSISNVLPKGNTLSEEGELVATMDFRDIYPLFTLIINPTPDSVCTALEESFGSCQPCPNDQGPYCLTVKAIYLGAAKRAGKITPVDASCAPTQ